MAEEVICKKEDVVEAASGKERPAEPMGTVIPMESVKPSVMPEVSVRQEMEKHQEPEKHQKSEVAAESVLRQEEPKRLAEASEADVQWEEWDEPQKAMEVSGHDGEKRRIHDFFRLRKDIENFKREDWILSRIPEKDLMEYLVMEQKKSEMIQKAKELKEKRIFTTLQIAISMAAIVAVVALLKDSPTVLVNILYITGIVIALWIWRGKQDK